MAQTSTATAVVPTGPIEDLSTSKPHHTTSSRLEDQAATAALYVSNRDASTKNGYEFLDSDYKLSSAGAAASLKYANPQDLPSFPSRGLKSGDSAAGAAASLGWSNQKAFEHWKPDPSTHASTAAMLAKDYKMAPLWQHEQSADGAKAALLAHKDGGKVEIWQPEASAWGNSAANQAFAKNRAGILSPQLNYGHRDLGRQGALLAATGAMATSRKRAKSTPIVQPKVETYPDENNAARNALKAAMSSASRSTRRSGTSGDAGAVPYTNMSREMYTSHPPVAPEVEEQNRNDTLRASAIAMARQMYNVQQKQIDAASNAHKGAMAAHRRPSSASSEGIQPMRFNNLQQAAQKLAQERLAKLHDEHAKNQEYRDYYSATGSGNASVQPQPSRMSIRGRTRQRSGSDGLFDEDREQSNKIRAQMSLFSSNLSQVDAKKRQADREALIAAAQRNVNKSLQGMDERVFADTGKVGPSLLNEWELKAHAAAQAKSDDRMENYGKVNIGGGKFINQSLVDLIAKKNVQPVLDEINDKAEKERERQATMRVEQENQKRAGAEKKTREKEEKDINKKLKREDKEERKSREAEERRLAKEQKDAQKEKRKSLKAGAAVVEPVKSDSAVTEPVAPVSSEPVAEPASPVEPTPVATPGTEPAEPTTLASRREPVSVPNPIRTSMEDQASLRMRENADAVNVTECTPMSPTSASNGKVKNWLKTKVLRRMSKSQKYPIEKETSKAAPVVDRGFLGGAALTGASANNSKTSLGRQASPTRDVGVERAIQENAESRGRTIRRASDEVSAMSEGRNEEFQEARDNFDEGLAPPPTFVAEKPRSPARETRFSEHI